MFIPALPGMQGSTESHRRLRLFDGKEHPVAGNLEAELRTSPP